jgi:hypothetical protein
MKTTHESSDGDIADSSSQCASDIEEESIGLFRRCPVMTIVPQPFPVRSVDFR